MKSLLKAVLGVFLLQLLCAAAFAWPASCLVTIHSGTGITSHERVLYFATDGLCYLVKDRAVFFFDAAKPGIAGSNPTYCLGKYCYTENPADPHSGVMKIDSWGETPIKYSQFSIGSRSEWTYVSFDGWPAYVYAPSLPEGTINTSSRNWVAPGKPSTLGTVIRSNSGQWVLIRAVSKTLKNFGVKSTCDSIKLTLNKGPLVDDVPDTGVPWNLSEATMIANNALFSVAGAFPLSKDAAEQVLICFLPSGNYTITTEASSEGEVLTEIYALPFALYP